jgi:hypothetical protein
VTLNGSEMFSGQFTYATTGSDTPAVSVTVSSDDDSASATVTVNEPAVFAVTITDADGAVAEGNSTTVSYTVENTGSTQKTQDITFEVDGTVQDTEPNVTLGGGETFDGTFSYQTQSSDTPEVTLTVSSADEANSTTVFVENSSFDIVASLSEAEGDINDTVEVELDVFSVGDTTDDLGGYQLGFSYNDSVLDFENAGGGAWGNPSSSNDVPGEVAIADFGAIATTPVEPAIILEFTVIGNGTSAVQFDDTVLDNSINDDVGDSYQTSFQDGAAGTSVNGAATATSAGNTYTRSTISVR